MRTAEETPQGKVGIEFLAREFYQLLSLAAQRLLQAVPFVGRQRPLELRHDELPACPLRAEHPAVEGTAANLRPRLFGDEVSLYLTALGAVLAGAESFGTQFGGHLRDGVRTRHLLSQAVAEQFPLPCVGCRHEDRPIVLVPSVLESGGSRAAPVAVLRQDFLRTDGAVRALAILKARNAGKDVLQEFSARGVIDLLRGVFDANALLHEESFDGEIFLASSSRKPVRFVEHHHVHLLLLPQSEDHGQRGFQIHTLFEFHARGLGYHYFFGEPVALSLQVLVVCTTLVLDAVAFVQLATRRDAKNGNRLFGAHRLQFSSLSPIRARN